MTDTGEAGNLLTCCPYCGASIDIPADSLGNHAQGGVPPALELARLVAGGPSGASGPGTLTCPRCGKEAYVRRSPKTGKMYLLGRADALSLDAARAANLYLGVCDDVFARFLGPAGVPAVGEETHGEGAAETSATKGVSKLVWNTLDRRRRAAARAEDWNVAGKLSLAKARYLHATGKPSTRFHRDAMRYQLLDLQTRGAARVRIAVARDAEVCPRCAALAGKVLTIEEALQTMPLPVSCDDKGRRLQQAGGGHGWCRCFYVRQE